MVSGPIHFSILPVFSTVFTCCTNAFIPQFWVLLSPQSIQNIWSQKHRDLHHFNLGSIRVVDFNCSWMRLKTWIICIRHPSMKVSFTILGIATPSGQRCQIPNCALGKPVIVGRSSISLRSRNMDFLELLCHEVLGWSIWPCYPSEILGFKFNMFVKSICGYRLPQLYTHHSGHMATYVHMFHLILGNTNTALLFSNATKASCVIFCLKQTDQESPRDTSQSSCRASSPPGSVTRLRRGLEPGESSWWKQIYWCLWVSGHVRQRKNIVFLVILCCWINSYIACGHYQCFEDAPALASLNG